MNEITMAAAGLLLLLAGASIGYLLGRRGRSDATSKLEETQTAFADYRKGVTRHFDQTAQQFQAIGQQYRDLYEHMAEGAEAFCVPVEPGSALPFSTQTRLPTDVEESELAAEDATEVAAEAEPVVHLTDVHPEGEAAAEVSEDGAAEDEAIEAETASADPDAETPDADEESASVEGDPEKAADDSERIYH